MFSQVFVPNRPHDYSFIARLCYGAVGTHPTGMLSCFGQTSQKLNLNHLFTIVKASLDNDKATLEMLVDHHIYLVAQRATLLI